MEEDLSSKRRSKMLENRLRYHLDLRAKRKREGEITK
jgi:hypothetical protein